MKVTKIVIDVFLGSIKKPLQVKIKRPRPKTVACRLPTHIKKRTEELKIRRPIRNQASYFVFLCLVSL